MLSWTEMVSIIFWSQMFANRCNTLLVFQIRKRKATKGEPFKRSGNERRCLLRTSWRKWCCERITPWAGPLNVGRQQHPNHSSWASLTVDLEVDSTIPLRRDLPSSWRSVYQRVTRFHSSSTTQQKVWQLSRISTSRQNVDLWYERTLNRGTTPWLVVSAM